MTDRPVLDHVNVVVRDMAAMVTFYRLLGIEIDAPTPSTIERPKWSGEQ